jgi:hypothetical protein
MIFEKDTPRTESDTTPSGTPWKVQPSRNRARGSNLNEELMKKLTRSLLVLSLTVGTAACGTQIMGPYNPDPGAYNPDPGAYNPDPGAYNPDPGAYNPDPGAYNPDPGAYNPDPGAYNPDPGA